MVLLLVGSMTLSITACGKTQNEGETIASSPVVTTGQTTSYDKDGNVIDPAEGEAGFGQDAEYASVAFSFTDNGDGTISDANTGLMWFSVPEAVKMTYSEALDYVENLEYAGYSDWRLPTPKELFSLSDFSEGWPYINTDYFTFNESAVVTPEGIEGGPQGSAPQGEEESMEGEEPAPLPEDPSDATESTTEGPSESASKEGGQFWTSALSQVEGDERLQGIAFGVNHVTGHIKAYPAEVSTMGKYVRPVRGDIYGAEDYTDNEDGTVTDNASGLMWMAVDVGECVEWEAALELAENYEYAGYTDWRLPDVKELQSIVDYSGAYPAINQNYFQCTETEENPNYYYWTSTSAYFSEHEPDYNSAWYVAFGYTSHGAGAVRFSPKYEESAASSEGEDNIFNSVRLVRNAD